MIARNTAQQGGGIETYGGPTIVGNLIVRNKASQQGGGIAWGVGAAGGPSPVPMNNTIAENDGLMGSESFREASASTAALS